LQRSGAEVFDDDVGLAQQAGKYVTGARLFQVQRDTVLTAKPVQRRHGNIVRAAATERYAVAPEVRWVLPARIGRLRIFDLDDAGAEASQEERGKRPREGQREIEDREARQRAARWRVAARHRVAGVYRSAP